MACQLNVTNSTKALAAYFLAYLFNSGTKLSLFAARDCACSDSSSCSSQMPTFPLIHDF